MTHPPKLDATATTLLLTLAAVWGGSFFFAEVALREIGPLTIALHRVSWAVPVLSLVCTLRRVEWPRGVRLWGAYLVMGGLNNAIPFGLIFWGQTRIDSGLASILNGTTAVWGAVVAGLLLRDEPLTPRKICGAALGLVGVAIIMGPAALGALDPANLGQIAVLGAALSYAMAGVWARLYLSEQPPLRNALGMVTASTGLLIPLVLMVEGVPRLSLSAPVWGALGGISVLSTSLAYLLYFAVLARAGAANLMLVTLLIPPFAIALGAIVLGERLEPAALAGFAIIATGLAVTDGRLLDRLSRA